MRLPTCAVRVQALPPQKISLQYETSRNGIVMVEMTETLTQDGKNYRIDSEARGKGLFALSNRGSLKRESRGVVEGGLLWPLEFRDQRGDRKPEFARFDWAKRVVLEERDGHTEATPIKGTMHDRLSFLWNFAFAPPGGKEIALDIADGRGVSRFRYAITGPEKLKTPVGEIDAMRLIKQDENQIARIVHREHAAKAGAQGVGNIAAMRTRNLGRTGLAAHVIAGDVGALARAIGHHIAQQVAHRLRHFGTDDLFAEIGRAHV